jgi:NADH-quinone oxidoreductase subunit D
VPVESLDGSRFNVNYQRVGGVLHDFPRGWLRKCEAYLDQLEKNMRELEALITGNEIFAACTQGVGYLNQQQEIWESIRLCRVAIDKMPGGSIGTRTPITLHPPRGETYFAIEGSEGELGIYLISDGSEYPWRAKIRGPSFVNLQVLPEMLRGYNISDEIAIMGSMDFVLGEVDR